MLKKEVLGQFIVLTVLTTISFCASAWVVKIDCNEGVDGNVVAQTNALNNFSNAAGATEYTREAHFEGGLGCKMQIKEGSSGWGTWGGRTILPSKLYKGGEIWIRVHTLFPVDFDYNVQAGASKLKFLRVHTASDSTAPTGSCTASNEGYNDWYIYPDTQLFGDKPFGFIKECHNSWREFGSFDSGVSIRKGVWETYEMYLKLDNVPVSEGGEGLVRVWRNNELLGEFKDVPTLNTANSYADSFLIFTYWNSNSHKTQHMYVDDLVITNQTPESFDSMGHPRIGVGDGAAVADADGDGITDDLDNCTLVPNSTQGDGDSDGYGNICDADLNQDGITNGLDIGPFKAAFGSNSLLTADFNGDGVVNGLDVGPLKAAFGAPPGPSCCGIALP